MRLYTLYRSNRKDVEALHLCGARLSIHSSMGITYLNI